jgi:enamine deaminase RidA (YjgF/YER057c/UK114 family)
VTRVLLPDGWPRPRGYANGVVARGETVFVSGMIGWTPTGDFPSDTIAGQTRLALENIVAVLHEAGAGPEHIVRMTWYVVNRRAYLDAAREIGTIYREVIGTYDTAMSVVEVSALMEARALVEIEATAVIPDNSVTVHTIVNES